MNVVREINRINDLELKLGVNGASWHDEYKDSAYIYVGGLNNELTEGDVITIFSQYGEVMDVNLPRDKETGKTRGFGFLMYEDQRSTVLAVDNLNGATVANRTLRVDHVKNYKQQKVKNDEGELVEREEQSLNARPEMVVDDDESSDSASSGPEIDPEDPMAAYMLQKRKEEKERERKKGKKDKSKKKDKHKDETPEERRARKERKQAKKALKKSKSAGLRGVEELLGKMSAGDRRDRGSRSRSPSGSRRERERDRDREREHDSKEPLRRAGSRDDHRREYNRHRSRDDPLERRRYERDQVEYESERDQRKHSPDARERRRREFRSKSPI